MKHPNEILVQSNGNHYVYSTNKKMFTYIHPDAIHLFGVQSSKSNKEKKRYYKEKYNSLLYPNNANTKAFIEVSKESIENALINVSVLYMGMTDECNLRCKYCYYGEYYTKNKWGKNKIEFEEIKTFINYMIPFWLKKQSNHTVLIRFVGAAEALLNFSTVEKTVLYLNQLHLPTLKFIYSITTNGIVMNKYIDFLVENDFELLISLDGDKENNKLRVFPNKSEAFDTISKNIEFIKEKYPVYFKEKVSFLSVLHHENDIQKVLTFFNEKYNKTPKLGSLVTNFLDKNHEDEFFQIYKNVDKILKTENTSEKSLYLKRLTLETVSSFIRGYLRNEFSDYRHLLTNKEYYSKTPTGTCDVFSTEMYLSPDAKIYACAGTQPEDYLGYIQDDKVIMDIEEIQTFYNRIYHTISKQCKQCYLSEMCPLCIYKLQDKTNPNCQFFTGAEQMSPFFEHFINYFEKTKSAYHNHLKNRIIQKYQHKQVGRLDI